MPTMNPQVTDETVLARQNQITQSGGTWQDVWDEATTWFGADAADRLASANGITADQVKQFGRGRDVVGIPDDVYTIDPVFPPPVAPPAPTMPPISLPDAPTFEAPTLGPAPTFTPPTADPAPTFKAPTAVKHQIDPETMTVQGQIGQILAEDGTLMQRAASQGLDLANARGLANSTMGVQAAQAAMMDRALPIAQSDAGAYLQSSLTNVAAQNQMNLAGFNANVQASLTAYNAQQEFAMAGFTANVNSKMAQYNAETTAALNAWTANVNSAQSAYAASVNAIMQKDQHGFLSSMEQYKAAVGLQMKEYEASVRMGELQFSARSNMELQMAADAAKLQQLNFTANANFKLQEAELASKEGMLATELASRADLQSAELQNAVLLQDMRNTASMELAQIEAEYKMAIQSSETAKSIYAQVSKNITDIMTSEDIPAEEKGAMIAQQTAILRSGLAIASSSGGTDFLAVLDFEGGYGSTGTTGGAVNSSYNPTIKPNTPGVGYDYSSPGMSGEDASVAAAAAVDSAAATASAVAGESGAAPE